MTIRRILRSFAVVALVFLPVGLAEAASPTVIVVDDDDQGADDIATLAWFEGRQIDLTKGWGRATACAVTETEIRCFRNEAQMDRYLGVDGTEAVGAPRAATSSFTALACSSAVRLYDYAWFGGSVLSVAIQWSVLNLGNYGWDNRTSSYKIGACPATFFSGPWGSGSVFGSTWAWAQVGSMGGWDNALSSLYIH